MDSAPEDGEILSLLAGSARLLVAGETHVALQYITPNPQKEPLVLLISFINTEKSISCVQYAMFCSPV